MHHLRNGFASYRTDRDMQARGLANHDDIDGVSRRGICGVVENP